MCNVELVDKRSMFSFNSLQLTTSRLRIFCLLKNKYKVWNLFSISSPYYCLISVLKELHVPQDKRFLIDANCALERLSIIRSMLQIIDSILKIITLRTVLKISRHWNHRITSNSKRHADRKAL